MPRTRGGLTRRGSSSSGRSSYSSTHDVPESSAQGATQKRPTTSARRRGQQTVPALPDQNLRSHNQDEDVIEHGDVDVAQDQEEGVGNDGARFPGGPNDTSLLVRYADHVARVIWEGKVSEKFL